MEVEVIKRLLTSSPGPLAKRLCFAVSYQRRGEHTGSMTDCKKDSFGFPAFVAGRF
jgi:hypothetical protein